MSFPYKQDNNLIYKLFAVLSGIFYVLLVLGVAFVIYSTSDSDLTGIVGFVSYDNSEIGDEITEEEIVVTREIAEDAIEETKLIIEEMQKNNFSIVYINDTLIEAKNVFEQAKYAEILRDPESTDSKKAEAREALKLVKWKDIDYEDVLTYTNEIKARKERAFIIYDYMLAAEMNLKESEKEGINTGAVKEILEQAKIDFYEDRYDEAEALLEEIGSKLELKRRESAIFSGLTRGTKNFFQRYWWQMVIFLIVLGIIGLFSYKRINLKLLKNKIKKMKIERDVLVDLMKKAQVERFKQNKISDFIYQIRMKKYQDKLQQIKEELPALEERAKNLPKDSIAKKEPLKS